MCGYTCVLSAGTKAEKNESMKNQESSANFNGHEAEKRKWPYDDASSYGYLPEKGVVAKKPMTSYNYDNFQPSQQYILSTASSNGQDQRNESNETVNCPQSTQMLNTMEITENIEYVNILYEDDLLTSIQAPAATESNYINFEPNWGNSDILDLDQRNYYYEANNTLHLNQLNGQLSHQIEQEPSIHQQMNHQTQSNLQLAEPNSSNQIHTITEYEVVQHVYPEADKSTTNLRKQKSP